MGVAVFVLLLTKERRALGLHARTLVIIALGDAFIVQAYGGSSVIALGVRAPATPSSVGRRADLRAAPQRPEGHAMT